MVYNSNDTTSHGDSDRRKNNERRRFEYTAHIPERREGDERRSGRDRRQNNRDAAATSKLGTPRIA